MDLQCIRLYAISRFPTTLAPIRCLNHCGAKASYDAYALTLFLGLPNDKSFRTKHQLGPHLRQGAQYSTYFINAANAKNPGARKTTRHALPRKLAQ